MKIYNFDCCDISALIHLLNDIAIYVPSKSVI